jgi:hypothetical protein
MLTRDSTTAHANIILPNWKIEDKNCVRNMLECYIKSNISIGILRDAPDTGHAKELQRNYKLRHRQMHRVCHPPHRHVIDLQRW